MPEENLVNLDEMSGVHRLMVGDKVELTTDGHDKLELNAQGEVVGFNNEERTYLDVEIDGEVYTLTDDELRRLPA
jgi:hypothetical protein